MNKKELDILKLLERADQLGIIHLINLAALTNPFIYSQAFIDSINDKYWPIVDQYFNL